VAPERFEPLLAVTLPLVPISVGIAILRYRLYEIDRIINRTLVYGLLTAILGLCYAAGSLVSILVVGVGSGPPSWLIAAATLTAAAVFRPARRRIQAVVDRRFNRRRYNAAQTIPAFLGRLRDQIDLDTLSSEVLAVVDQTMEPTHVSLWLRPSPTAPPTPPAARHDQPPGPTELVPHPETSAAARLHKASNHLSDGPLAHQHPAYGRAAGGDGEAIQRHIPVLMGGRSGLRLTLPGSHRGRAGAAHHRKTTGSSGVLRSADRAGQQPFPSVRPGHAITRIASRTEAVRLRSVGR
jgi:hypothetical protein